MKRDAVGGPRLDYQIESFEKARAALGLGDAVAAEVRGNCAAPDAELDAAIAQHVQNRDLFRDTHRMRQRQPPDTDAEAPRARTLCDCAEEQWRGGDGREDGV